MKTKIYQILYKSSTNQSDLYQYVQKVLSEVGNRPNWFIAECTDEQVSILENHDGVKEVIDHVALLAEGEIQEQVITNNTLYFREYQNVRGWQAAKNWGLVRHTNTTNTTAFNALTNGQYQINNNGHGVDIILHTFSALNKDDPQFMTNGVTRIKDYDWGQIPGFAGPTAGFNMNPSDSQVDEHAEAVAYCCASNDYGWATGADLYIFPWGDWANPNLYGAAYQHGWDAFKYFHQNKGNSRPTVVVDAFCLHSTTITKSSTGGSILFRNDIYNKLGAGGITPREAIRHGALLNNNSIFWKANGIANAYGGFPTHWQKEYKISKKNDDGNYVIDPTLDAAGLRSLFQTGTGDSPSTDAKNKIKTFISNVENQEGYETLGGRALKEMEEAGVHHIAAAGNYQQKHSLPDNIDFSNCILTTFQGRSTVKSGNSAPTNPYYTAELLGSRGGHSAIYGPNTIAVGALSSEFSVYGDLNGKETMADFSDRGDRVDCCAAGHHIYLNLYSNGQYDASGTSFASPNVAGMAAIVLTKYPNTSPLQLRKYFRDHAVGQDTLYDTGQQRVPSSNRGDWSYFADGLGLKGYSGKIVYLDPQLQFDPSTQINNNPVTSTEAIGPSNIVGHSIAEINTILDG